MKHCPVSFRVVALSFVMALCLAAAAGSAAAGEARNPIPPRVPKIEKGDWSLLKDDDGFTRETVTDIEKTEGDVIVHYTMEKFDLKGKQTEKPQEVARFLSDEAAENNDFMKTMKVTKAERRRAKIDGKNVNVVVLIIKDTTSGAEDGTTLEYWFSDEISVDGKVAMIVPATSEENQDYKVYEVVGFGDAKTKFNLKKYLD